MNFFIEISNGKDEIDYEQIFKMKYEDNTLFKPYAGDIKQYSTLFSIVVFMYTQGCLI